MHIPRTHRLHTPPITEADNRMLKMVFIVAYSRAHSPIHIDPYCTMHRRTKIKYQWLWHYTLLFSLAKSIFERGEKNARNLRLNFWFRSGQTRSHTHTNTRGHGNFIALPVHPFSPRFLTLSLSFSPPPLSTSISLSHALPFAHSLAHSPFTEANAMHTFEPYTCSIVVLPHCRLKYTDKPYRQPAHGKHDDERWPASGAQTTHRRKKWTKESSVCSASARKEEKNRSHYIACCSTTHTIGQLHFYAYTQPSRDWDTAIEWNWTAQALSIIIFRTCQQS